MVDIPLKYYGLTHQSKGAEWRDNHHLITFDVNVSVMVCVAIDSRQLISMATTFLTSTFKAIGKKIVPCRVSPAHRLSGVRAEIPEKGTVN